MSEKEQAVALLDLVPDSKMGYVLAYLQGLTAEEDDAFCEALYQRYEADGDKGEFTSIEDAAKLLGVSL